MNMNRLIIALSKHVYSLLLLLLAVEDGDGDGDGDDVMLESVV